MSIAKRLREEVEAQRMKRDEAERLLKRIHGRRGDPKEPKTAADTSEHNDNRSAA